jgi:uncharacterized protein (DUF1330 family)
MTVYAIALINIADRERYGAYQQGFMEILSKYRGSLLAVDEAPTVKEGDWPLQPTSLVLSHRACRTGTPTAVLAFKEKVVVDLND